MGRDMALDPRECKWTSDAGPCEAEVSTGLLRGKIIFRGR